MRAKWALVVVGVCVLAGMVGVAGAVLISQAAPGLARPALVQPDRAGGNPLLERLPALIQPDRVLPDQAQPSVPRTSTATRHVRSPQEAVESGELHPATDRVMALLVGWVLLASLGGGLIAPRH